MIIIERSNRLHHNHRHLHHNHQHYIPPSQGISIGLLLLGGVLTLITLAMGALARYIPKMHVRTIRDVLNSYQICHIYVPVFFEFCVLVKYLQNKFNLILCNFSRRRSRAREVLKS